MAALYAFGLHRSVCDCYFDGTWSRSFGAPMGADFRRFAFTVLVGSVLSRIRCVVGAALARLHTLAPCVVRALLHVPWSSFAAASCARSSRYIELRCVTLNCCMSRQPRYTFSTTSIICSSASIQSSIAVLCVAVCRPQRCSFAGISTCVASRCVALH
jgi:hypothetical protein